MHEPIKLIQSDFSLLLQQLGFIQPIVKTKICAKCGIEKPLSDFHKNQTICKICRRKYMKKYNALPATKESKRKSSKLTRSKERRKKYMINNIELINQYRKKSQAKAINSLADSYVVQIIHFNTKMGKEEIRKNPELIEQKRNMLKLKRSIKQLKQAQNETSKR